MVDIRHNILCVLQLYYLQDSIYEPMTVPPLPWKGVYFGGHLLPTDTFLRLKSLSLQLDPLLAYDSCSGKLSKVRQFSASPKMI